MTAQLGHTDPTLTLRVYTHIMRRGEGERGRLRALVEEPAADESAEAEHAESSVHAAGASPTA